MRVRRALTTLAAAVTAATLTAVTPAAAATTSFTVSTTGLSAEAVFSNFPANGTPVPGTVYTDVFVFAADQATTVDGTTFTDDFAFVDVFKYKFDWRGVQVPVSDRSGQASGDRVTFSGDARKLTTASLTARVPMETCTATGCTASGTATISISWTGDGPTTTYKSSYRTNDPGQFHATGRMTGTSRVASATGTVPVLGSARAIFAGITSSKSAERTICHGC
jgi:hypothetical protein